MTENKLWPVAGLLFAAAMWGIMWYPYRLLREAGMAGELSTFVTYAVALCGATLLFPRAWRELTCAPKALAGVALAAGWCNLSYVLAILNGEVMRVLLLFYLAPLWTVPLAWIILGERVNRIGYLVIVFAFLGAVVMLWNPAAGLPMPSNGAEWLGVSAGFSFALANVMTRRAENCGIAVKALSAFIGVILVSLIALLFRQGSESIAAIASVSPMLWLVLLIGVMQISMTFAVQYGLTHLPATRAIVILLFELVVAAVAAYFLADEVMDVKEVIGGAMIIAASLFSGHMKRGLAPEK